MAKRRERILTPRQACQVLGVSYAALKQWIYKRKLRTIRTPGGHHRIPESEIDRGDIAAALIKSTEVMIIKE